MNQVSVYEQSHDSRGSSLSVIRLRSWEHTKMIYCNWHREIELVYVRRGILTLTMNERQQRLSPGEIGIINREEVHYGGPEPGEPCEADAILLDAGSLLPAADTAVKKELRSLLSGETLLIPSLTADSPHYCEICGCLERMIQTYREQGAGYAFHVTSLVYELLFYFFSGKGLTFSALNGDTAQNREKTERLNEVLRYIEENYSRKIYIAELADRLYMGVDNFYKFFVSVTGVSPAVYMNSFRMKQAASLLTGTSLPVTEICFKVGFNNVSYFIKTFQKFYGNTPKRYRGLSQRRNAGGMEEKNERTKL